MKLVRLRHFSALSTSILILATAGCGDDSKRPIGANCTQAGECELGQCGGGLCIDPERDDDVDGLINRIEAALGTDPIARDSDADGVDDLAEVGSVDSPTDGDSDGRIDAIESLLLDCDRDESVDQLDPDDGLDAKGACAHGLGGTVISVCDVVCLVTDRLRCPGFVRAGCVDECRGYAATTAANCRDAFIELVNCFVDNEITCPNPAESGFDYLPEETGGACDAKIFALAGCSEPLVRNCTEPTRVFVDIPQVFRFGDGGTFKFEVEPGVSYEITVTPDPGADFDLRLYDEIQVMCEVPEASLAESRNGVDQVESVVSPPQELAGDLYLLIQNVLGGDIGFELSIREFAP